MLTPLFTRLSLNSLIMARSAPFFLNLYKLINLSEGTILCVHCDFRIKFGPHALVEVCNLKLIRITLYLILVQYLTEIEHCFQCLKGERNIKL